MDTLLPDLRYAVRTLRKSPGFTLVAVLTLALGIGANTAIFSVVNAVLLRPLPYSDADALVLVWNRYSGLGLDQASSSPPDYFDRRQQNRVFSEMGAFWQTSATLTGGGGAERLNAARATASFFSVLGVPPLLGRTFLPEEDQPGGGKVAVLSHGFWQRRFGGDRGVVGSRVVLDGNPVTVVGVMPERFGAPKKVDLWMPAAFTPEQMSDAARGNEWLTTVARLKPGVTQEAAQSDMQRVALGLKERFPEHRDYLTQSGWGAKVVGMREQGAAPVRSVLLLLLGTVGLVLLIACANVANLLMVRATRRRKEMAIRAALGAGRLRIVRQLLVESLVLAVLGGTLGLLLGYWVVNLLLALYPQGLLGVESLPLDMRVLGYTLGISIVTGAFFGLAPAQGPGTARLSETLRSGGKTSSTGSAGQPVRDALVAAEVALTLMLLVAAGLMLRSFSKLLDVDPGFRTSQLVTFRTSLPSDGYPEAAQVVAFYDALGAQLRALPGVQGVGITSKVPLAGGGATRSVQAEGRPVVTGEGEMLAGYTVASGDYFRAMKIPLLGGRTFDATDQASAPPVVILDRQLARRLWPTEKSPIGKRIRTGADTPWMTVVGVAGDVRGESLGEAGTNGMLYRPYTQDASRDMTLVVHTPADPARVVPMVREVARKLNPNLPVFDVAPIQQVVSASVAMPQMRTRMLGLFAALALVLAGVGIYGVVAYSVSQRTQEIGVRMALGAEPGGVLRMVLASAMRVVLIGVVLGFVGALFAARLIRSLLFEVSASDPVTFVSVTLLLVAVALVASLVPALRATRVEPTIALRAD